MVVFLNTLLECENHLILKKYPFILVFVHVLKVTTPICNTLEAITIVYYLKAPSMYFYHFVMDQHQFMSIFQDFEKWYNLHITQIL